MATVNPYLTLNGNCEEVFNYYKSVFGGEFTYVGRFSEMPAEYQIPENERNKIMHISLPISKETSLMGADAYDESDSEGKPRSNFAVSIYAASEEEAIKLFNDLSAGGKVTLPLDKTFWGALFGMFTDKFGINWLMSYDYKTQENG